MGNGETERFNQTLLGMLGTLEEHQKADWKSYIPTLVHAYNSTHHKSTGFSPHFLMFGRHPRLAIDAFLGLPTEDIADKQHTEYVAKLRKRLSESYDRARQNARSSGLLNKKHYDKSARSTRLQPGDIVLVRNVALRGKQKLADRWEHQPYVIVAQPNSDTPVYEVKREGARFTKTKRLHRNLLLPFMTVTDGLLEPSKPCHKEQQAPSTLEASGSDTDDEEGKVARPQRKRKKPLWMTTGDFVA
jgi:hypothetical protein